MIIPMLVCRDAAAEIVFCQQAFGAVELSRREAEDGSVVHATLRIGGSLLMVHDVSPHLESRAPSLEGGSPVFIHLHVEEIDAVIERARAAGARVLLPAADRSGGERAGRPRGGLSLIHI